jgi:hypothetical protein
MYTVALYGKYVRALTFEICFFIWWQDIEKESVSLVGHYKKVMECLGETKTRLKCVLSYYKVSPY